MNHFTRLACSVTVGFALAAPTSALGQAVARGSAPSESPSAPAASPSSGGGSDRGSGSVPASSGRTQSSSSRVTGSATSRSSGSQGGSTTTSGGEQTASTQGSRTGSGNGSSAGSNSSGTAAYGRSRGNQPIQGGARARRPGEGDTGLDLDTYSPWRFDNPLWLFGSYGYWYDPYDYSPRLYRPYGGAYGYSPYGYSPWGYSPWGPWGYDTHAYGDADPSYSGRDRDDERSARMGAIRLRANPREAKVYVDGALVGVVDDFDGLSSHLDLEAGSHQLELRATGYKPQTVDVVVEIGKTRTARISLKKN